MTNIDISVIIPVYNTEAYLARCLQSVVAQKGVGLEVVLVDDGSTDASGRICDQFAADYPFIRVIHTPNGGPATAKNIGLKAASGEYISFIDSDDAIQPDMYREMWTLGKEHEADIVCCGYSEVDEVGHASTGHYSGERFVFTQHEAMRRFLIRDRIYSQSWTKIYRRKMLTDHHLANRDGLKTDEDHIFNLYAFLHCSTVCLVDKPLYIYTNRSTSLSKDYYKKHIDNLIQNMSLRLELVDSLIHERMPQLEAYSTRHCLRYYNELIGKVCQFPSTYSRPEVKKIFRYMRTHRRMLWRYRTKCGLSAIGTLLLLVLPRFLYLRYRRFQTR